MPKISNVREYTKQSYPDILIFTEIGIDSFINKGVLKMDFLGSTGIYTLIFVCVVIIGILYIFAKKVK